MSEDQLASLPPLSSDPDTNIEMYRLAILPIADCERQRKDSAKRLGLRPNILDDQVKQARRNIKSMTPALGLGAANDEFVPANAELLDTGTTLTNVVTALSNPHIIGYNLAYDEFTADELITGAGCDEWRSITDADLTELRMRLETIGIEHVGREMLRDALRFVVDMNRFDTGKVWANGLPEWDGVPRVEGFYPEYLRTENSPYARALGLYTWTALAGRLLKPGCKADMVPTWIGKQGSRKTTGVMSIVPSPEHYAEISFSEPEIELARKQRGKLVLEIAELSGLSKKERESQKAWITRQEEEWTPKYRERTTRFKRRALCIATTNVEEFLQDSTGNRRWLPIKVGNVDVEGIITHREQLWAEAVNLFEEHGVMWRQAETEAAKILNRHEVENPFVEVIRKWLETPQNNNRDKLCITEGGIDTNDRPADAEFIRLETVMKIALEIRPAEFARHQNRVAEAMQALGYHKVRRRHISGESSFPAWVPDNGVTEEEVHEAA